MTSRRTRPGPPNWTRSQPIVQFSRCVPVRWTEAGPAGRRRAGPGQLFPLHWAVTAEECAEACRDVGGGKQFVHYPPGRRRPLPDVHRPLRLMQAAHNRPPTAAPRGCSLQRILALIEMPGRTSLASGEVISGGRESSCRLNVEQMVSQIAAVSSALLITPEPSRRESNGRVTVGQSCVPSVDSGNTMTGWRCSIACEPATPLFTPVTVRRLLVTATAERSSTGYRDDWLKRDFISAPDKSSVS